MIRVLTSDVKEALGLIKNSVTTRSTLAILGGVKLESKGDGKLTFQATNLETFVVLSIPCKGDDVFSTVVPYKTFRETVAVVRPAHIDLDMKNALTLKLEAEGLGVALKGMDSADFPYFPTTEDATVLSVPTTKLIELFGTATYAASTDESRPTLTGCEITFGDGWIKEATTDGYRLALKTIQVAGASEGVSVIIPAKSINDFVRIAEGAKSENVDLIMVKSRNQLILAVKELGDRLTDVSLVTQLIDARFPDYNTIIPKVAKTTVTVPTTTLLHAVKTAMLFAKSSGNIVNLAIAPNGSPGFGYMTLLASDAELGDSEEKLLVEFKGDEIKISFNGKYMMEMLAHIEAAQVVIEYTENTRPCKARGQTSVDGSEYHIVMPMHPQR